MIGATAEANAQVNGTSPLSNALLKGLGVGGKQCASIQLSEKSAILGPLGVQYRNNTSGCLFLIFGASGNTGTMAIQFGKKMGAKVIAVSKDEWVKDFGADYVIDDYDKVTEKVNEFTQGKMVDVVLNSLGVGTWDSSFASVGVNGRWVAFWGLTAADVTLNVQSLYSKQIKLIGSTGGSRNDFRQIIDMSKELKIRVWKKFKLDEAKEALQALFAKERDGRIMLEI